MIPADMYARQVIQDIKGLMIRVDCTECRYIPRQTNQVAHYIANRLDFISINHNTEHVLSFIEMGAMFELIRFIKEVFSQKKTKKTYDYKSTTKNMHLNGHVYTHKIISRCTCIITNMTSNFFLWDMDLSSGLVWLNG